MRGQHGVHRGVNPIKRALLLALPAIYAQYWLTAEKAPCHPSFHVG